jgi:predicted glycoside hydrolase/deacetylase ChbG (UPF0249 family)
MQDEVHKAAETGQAPSAVVIVNADDWGLNAEATDRIFDCAQVRAISSVSAMMFMDDSERAASLARELDMDAGIHLNLTCGFTAPEASLRLREHQQRITAFLRSGRYARVIFNPLLVAAFDYVIKAQIEEFERLYGVAPNRLDGHHHMHLCGNVLLQGLLPSGATVRRNQSFTVGEKGSVNRWYRRTQDVFLSKRHPMADYFFDLVPIQPVRLRRILELAREFNVEFETHPDNADEYRFLMRGELVHCCEDVMIAPGYHLRALGSHAGPHSRQSEPYTERAIIESKTAKGNGYPRS